MKRGLIGAWLVFGLVACGDDDMGGDAGLDASDCACDDGVFCNGVEVCMDGTCVAGEPPCATGACDEDAEECIEGCADADGDGDCAVAEGGTDCDDEDPARYGGALEICDSDGVDEDCDGTTLGPDGDGDGYAALECCNLVDGDLTCGLDCNDASMEVNPEAEEICDERDNDCDGTSDEGVQMLYYRDADSDNYGTDTDTVLACSLPTGGYAVRGGDCDDDLFDDDPTDPPANERNPGRSEICNEIDDDCDGIPDPLDCDCEAGETRSCAEAGFLGDCAVGTQTCTSEGVWDSGCPTPAANESCGGGDEDCDGSTNEPGADGALTCWADADEDGFASAGAVTSMQCACSASWTDEDPATNADCDDGASTVYPGADELCDLVRNNCNNTTHNPVSEDRDGDGYAAVTAACSGGFPREDCDDGRAERNPEATFQTVAVCPPGRSEELCPVRESIRCFSDPSCPSSCAANEGGGASSGGNCRSGSMPCTCTEPARRCLPGGSSCTGCSPTEGTSADRDGNCDSRDVACDCYLQWLPSCETSSSCLLETAGDAEPPSVWDFDCNGDEELAPDDTGLSCSMVDGMLECSAPCTGARCDNCPDVVYTGGAGTRECGAPGQTALSCRTSFGGDTCLCTEDSDDEPLACR